MALVLASNHPTKIQHTHTEDRNFRVTPHHQIMFVVDIQSTLYSTCFFCVPCPTCPLQTNIMLLYCCKKNLIVPLILTISTRSSYAAFYPVQSLLRRSFSSLTRTTTTTTTTTTAMSSSSSSSSTTLADTTTENNVIPGRPTWQQTMLRIKDPAKSIPFYQSLGFTLIDSFDFPQYKFSLYFLTTLPADDDEQQQQQPYQLTPGTQAAHDYLWNMEGVALELTHNHGTENNKDDTTTYHAGNQEKDGFGHIAVNVDDVYATCDKLEKAGYSFKKKPNEGRMKGLAFVYDPDGYWVEVVKRGENAKIANEYNFSQTMLRVKDPKKSIAFYQKLGMKLLRQSHYESAKFSNYFMASSNVADGTDMKTMFAPVLELTHNHGTENDESFKHYNGNEEGRQGFGHVGLLVDDVYAACDAIRPLGYGFRKEPDGGSMKGLAFAYDPDGYSVEIIKRGGMDFGDVKKE